MKIRIALLPLFFVWAQAAGEDYGAIRQRIRELGRLTTPPAIHKADGLAGSGNLHAIFYDGLPYHGKPTRVFAWYGIPEGARGKVPGIVLVHGGGGTAFKEWVQKWNQHGFAAISMALEGQTDERVSSTPAAKGESPWKRQQWGGPARDGIYGDSAEPIWDQWMYHAVADTVLANSLMRSLPEVDANRVGLMGISWGGVITATVMGIDKRFLFAIPVYGGGSMANSPNNWGQALHDNALYHQAWDPILWLPNARMPAFWFTDLHDIHFPLTSQSASYHTAPGLRMVAVLPDMKHGHAIAWNPPDSYAFGESVAHDGRPWLHQESGRREDDRAVVEFSSAKKIDSAELLSTTETGFTGERKWVQTPAVLRQHEGRAKATAALPAGTTAWFINVHAGNLTASSDFVE